MKSHNWEQCWGRKTWTVVDEFLEAPCGEVWELKTPGGGRGTVLGRLLHFCGFYLQEPYQVLTVKTGEKSHASGRGRGESRYFDIHQSTLFFLTRPTLKTNYYIKAWPMKVLWESDRPGRREIPYSRPLYPSCLTLGGESWEALWCSQCRGTGSRRDWDLIVGV